MSHRYDCGLGSAAFDRLYLRYHMLFSFPPATKMFQFTGFAPDLVRYRLRGGLPHSDICGSRDICSSPQLFAAYHVLLRLREPRHPLCALVSFLYNFCIEILMTCIVSYKSSSFCCSCYDFLRFQNVNVLYFQVVLGRVELPTSTLSV